MLNDTGMKLFLDTGNCNPEDGYSAPKRVGFKIFSCLTFIDLKCFKSVILYVLCTSLS